jgi:putative glutamine amidotransferase
MSRISFIRLAGLIFLLSTGCRTHNDPVLLLVSREYDQRFIHWPGLDDPSVKMVSMYHAREDSLQYYLDQADGIIISGGPDVNPSLYGMGSEKGRCGPLDPHRDTMELEMIRHAMRDGTPLLCICRGHQILNVANGGTLIVDIPSDVGTGINHASGDHMVRVVSGSLLSEIVQTDCGLVNSGHHQAVATIAPGFRASAFSTDGIIEAIEPLDPKEHPFILGVQWHPETMIRTSESPFTSRLAEHFMSRVIEKHRRGP